MPRFASHVSGDRTSTSRTPASHSMAAPSASTTLPSSSSTSPVSGCAAAAANTRVVIRSGKDAMKLRRSLSSSYRIHAPSGVPQSSSKAMISCATSIIRRVS